MRYQLLLFKNKPGPRKLVRGMSRLFGPFPNSAKTEIFLGFQSIPQDQQRATLWGRGQAGLSHIPECTRGEGTTLKAQMLNFVIPGFGIR